MKVLAIDYGEKRVGLALGDTETKLALPYGTLARTSDEELVTRLRQVIAEEEVERLVVGEPVTLGGGASVQTELSRAFAELLKQELHLPVIMMDERFTSQRADAATAGAGAATRGRDELAAMFILQDYLERPPSP